MYIFSVQHFFFYCDYYFTLITYLFFSFSRQNDFESRKPQLARQINEARKKGDSEKAKELCDELNSLSTLRFDPTNPDGIAGEWDGNEYNQYEL